MAKPKQPTAVEQRAYDSVSREQKSHARYKVERFAEADSRGDTQEGLDNARLRRVLPVRGLEALEKDERMTLDVIQAANLYHADLMTAEGVGSAEVQERVDTSGDPCAQADFLADCKMRLGYVRGKIGGKGDLVIEMDMLDRATEAGQKRISEIAREMAVRDSHIDMIDTLFTHHPDKRLSAIFGKGRPYTRARNLALDVLERLSEVYGLRSASR